MKASARPPSATQQEFARRLVASFTGRIRSDAEAVFIAALTEPRPPLPPVDLTNRSERLVACCTGLGYVAGLAGRRARPAAFPRDLGPGSLAWENGWRQGRDHRARMLGQAEPLDAFTRNRLAAAIIRCEAVPA